MGLAEFTCLLVVTGASHPPTPAGMRDQILTEAVVVQLPPFTIAPGVELPVDDFLAPACTHPCQDGV
jgi:hypothetical protein